MEQLIYLFWNRDQARLRAVWRLGLHFILWLLITVLLQLSIGGPLTSWTARFLPSLDGFAGRVATFGIILIAILISTWLAVRFLDHRPFAELGFQIGREWWLDLLFGLVLGAVLMMLVFGLEYMAGWVRVTGTFEITFGKLPFWLAILGPAITFICVGVYEELVFRGYQLRNLAEGLNFPPIGTWCDLVGVVCFVDRAWGAACF